MTDEQMWALADTRLRDPNEVVEFSPRSLANDPALIDARTVGPFWDLLQELEITLLVTREYEHLAIAMSCDERGPSTTMLRLPHPSGIAVDHDRGVVYIACTRNPNQIVQLEPTTGALRRTDRPDADSLCGLVPTVAQFLPGCLYLHDLALVDGRLMGNAVGMNAVVDLSSKVTSIAWWPKSIESVGQPDHSRNLIQLNSIAAGGTLEESFYTASTSAAGRHFPGDTAWEVDRQGVVFDGRSREPVVGGLTRPHSARLTPDGALWVNDSGYGTLNLVDGSSTVVVASLDGWTRGLCMLGRYAVVGTSRVIPRFAGYAPGLNGSGRCGLNFVDLETGAIEASLEWPAGNQIFAIDWIPSNLATGFLAGLPAADAAAVDQAWYRFSPAGSSLGPLSD